MVVESKQELEPVLTPLPRGTERTVLDPCRRPGLVMTSPVQEVRIRVIYISFRVVKRAVLKLEDNDKTCLAYVTIPTWKASKLKKGDVHITPKTVHLKGMLLK